MSRADIRRLAGEIAADLDDPEALRRDAALREGVTLARELKAKQLAGLIRTELPAVAVIAAVAAGRREVIPPRLGWALVNRFHEVPAGAGVLMLEALARSAGPNVLVHVLVRVDADWLAEPRRGALLAFVRARLELGERLRPATFEHVERPVAEAIREALPEHVDTAPAADTAFFEELGRMVDLDVRCVPVGARPAAIAAIGRALARRRSVLLVGEHGVGKATVARAALHELGGWQAFEAGAAAVNAGQMYIGQLEGRVREIAEKMRGNAIAWLFPDLEDAVWAGQHSRSERGLLDALLPHVEAGETVVVGMIGERAYEQLVRSRPKVATAFEAVRLPPVDAADAIRVAEDWLAAAGLSVPRATLAEAHDLAGHYLANIAAPGSLLRLLALTTERGDVAGAELLDTLAESTGLSLDLLDPRTRLDLDATRAFFAGRVLGQPEAVDVLVERIALVKAGLTDPTRPLGVFLFVGPTGTGKTELAKALSELLFGTEDRMVRLDMSEYKTPDANDRLLAEDATLIPSVRAQPFSVVLLDEFEKAHPSVWDLFLAVFDDGRLTDRSGRVTDFRHCVIILTSNVGSALPSGPGLGFAGGSSEFATSGVERAVAQAFRPELLNRFDRVVVFRPLGRDVMRALLEVELESVLRRRGLRLLPWAVEFDEAAMDFLLDRGYTAALGARPMKRAIERELLAPLAVAMVEREYPEGDQFLFISASGDRLTVAFVDPDESEPSPAVASPDFERISARVRDAGARKDEALRETRMGGFWDRPDRAAVLGEVEYLDRLEAAWATAGRLRARGAADLLEERLWLLDQALAGLDAGHPFDTTISLRFPKRAAAWADELRGMYAAWAARRGMKLDGEHVVGLGCHTILLPEAGLHVLEDGDAKLSVQVLVGGEGSRRIVRRYRRAPSPLVRDSVRGWRTGRIDRVLGGDFDRIR